MDNLRLSAEYVWPPAETESYAGTGLIAMQVIPAVLIDAIWTTGGALRRRLIHIHMGRRFHGSPVPTA